MPAEKGLANLGQTAILPAVFPVQPEVGVFDSAADRYLKAGPELRRIMEETERLIGHARSNEEQTYRKFDLDKNRRLGNPDMLH
ncbi:MAG: hypothetical protein HY912_18360 [Desulfomonile tiedjei]|uniref:Uncharacterized protein n=1 Tax=Desulfomonile tiedjei TaxID=2358 RepID=A0A9D6V7M9_9BACT|nr:hypothetical protein [Desulfomonile tiedjei]